MSPFTLHVADADIADLRDRLARTRFPDAAPGEPWAYGASVDYLRDLVGYWREGFDWRKAEAKLNAYPQFKHARDDIDLHFLHVPGKGPAPTPLLLMHGWPGSVFEFVDFIPRLTDPAAFGADPADAFTVIAPSLPGYGLSFRPGQARYGVEEIAACLVELMTQTLGYERFAVQGGDWGAIIAAHMGAAHADKLIGLHVNMLAVPRERSADPAHRTFSEEMKHWLDEETGYQAIQGTKPQTLSFGLTDSPAGLAAWIVEKFYAWSDGGGEVETALTRDQMLANIGLYWFTRGHRLVVLPLLFPQAARLAGFARAPGDGADRLRRLPKGNGAAAARDCGKNLPQPAPLDRIPARRPFRGDGAAGGAGGRRARVFPRPSLAALRRRRFRAGQAHSARPVPPDRRLTARLLLRGRAMRGAGPECAARSLGNGQHAGAAERHAELRLRRRRRGQQRDGNRKPQAKPHDGLPFRPRRMDLLAQSYVLYVIGARER